MSEQPTALRLADELDAWEKVVCGSSVMATATIKLQQTAAELRRLHEVNQELLEALKYAEAGLADIGDADREPGDDLAWCEQRAAEALPTVRAAIAKGEQA